MANLNQYAQNSTGATGGFTTLTITLPGVTGRNTLPNGANALIVGVLTEAATTAPVPSSVTIGATALALAKSYQPENGGFIGIYYIASVPAGQTVVTITVASTANSLAAGTAVEFAGMATTNGALLDQVSAGTATETSAWSSGATPTTTSFNEVAIGLFGGWNSASFTPAGPAYPWFLLPQVTTATIDAFVGVVLTGYDFIGNKQAVTYSGTGGNTNFWNTAIAVTFVAVNQPLVYKRIRSGIASRGAGYSQYNTGYPGHIHVH